MSNNFNYNDFITTETLDQQEAEFVGIEVNPSDSQTKIPVIYGFRRVEPVTVITSLTPTDATELICVYAISEGYCKGIHKIYIDGNDTGLTSTQLVHRTPVSPTSGAYAGIFTAEFLDGRDGTSATNALNLGPSELALQKLGRRIAFENLSYLVCRFKYNSGGPYKQVPKISVEFFGRYIPDVYAMTPPRFTVEFGTNPLNVIVDMLTNTNYGAGIPVDKIDVLGIMTLDPFVLQPDAQRYQPSSSIWSVNWIMDTNTAIRSNIEVLLETYNIFLYYSNGKYTFAFEEYPEGTATLDENSIIGSISVQYPSQSTKLNRCYVEYIDPASNFQSNSVYWPEEGVVHRDFVLDDAGVPLEKRITANSIIRRTEAGDLAQMTVRRSRDQVYYSFRATKEIYKFRVGDVLTIDLDFPPILDTVIITKLVMNSDFTFQVEAASWNAGFYPENFGAQYSVTTRPPSLVPGTVGVQRPVIDPTIPAPPPVPQFTVTSSADSITEGQSITFTITSTVNLNNAQAQYDLTGSTITSADFTGATPLSGILVFTGVTASLTLTLADDAVVEGNEFLIFTARLSSTQEIIGGRVVQIIDKVAQQPPSIFWLDITSPPTGTQAPTFLKLPPPTDAFLTTTANNPEFYIGPLNTAKTGVVSNLVNTSGIQCRVRRPSTSSRFATLDVGFTLIDRLTSRRQINRQIICVWGAFSAISGQQPFGYHRRSLGSTTIFRYNPSAPPIGTDQRQSQRFSPAPAAPGEILTVVPGGGIRLLRTENGIYSNVSNPLQFVINVGSSLSNSNATQIPNYLGTLGATGGVTLTFKFFELFPNSASTVPVEIGHARYNFALTTANISPLHLADSRVQYFEGTGANPPF